MDNNAKIRCAVFASGSGTNAENLIRHAQENPNFEIPVVICDKPKATVIDRCKALNTKCLVIPYAGSKTEHEKEILNALADYDIDWIFLAGYMRILQQDFLDIFFDAELGTSRIVNIHPSRLPEFPGINAYQRAFDAGVETSGVTVHFVDGGVDSGPIILQKTFPRKTNDTLESFTQRGFALEYKTYIEAIDILLQKISQPAYQEKRA